MMVVDVADIPIVAGVKAGAGAEETVCVRDAADRDLSRNSITDCGGVCQGLVYMFTSLFTNVPSCL